MHDEITISGITITANYQTAPVVGHGHFVIHNQSGESITVSTGSITVVIGEESRTVALTSIFDRSSGESLPPGPFTVEHGTGKEVLLGFPEVPFSAPLGTPVEVVCRFTVAGAVYEASSPFNFIRRIPR
ncbi:MAG: hypothetical protein WA952_08525 [Lewinella sp.]